MQASMPVRHHKQVAPKLTPKQQIIQQFIQEERMNKDVGEYSYKLIREAEKLPNVFQAMAQIMEINTAYSRWEFEKKMKDNLHYLVYPERVRGDPHYYYFIFRVLVAVAETWANGEVKEKMEAVLEEELTEEEENDPGLRNRAYYKRATDCLKAVPGLAMVLPEDFVVLLRKPYAPSTVVLAGVPN